jgi:antitoxin VbhA-like protein
MARITTTITHEQRTERQARVARAVASVRLEGLEPTEAAKAVFDRYVSGDLSTDEMAAEIRALNARQFGPIHVSGD